MRILSLRLPADKTLITPCTTLLRMRAMVGKMQAWPGKWLWKSILYSGSSGGGFSSGWSSLRWSPVSSRFSLLSRFSFFCFWGLARFLLLFGSLGLVYFPAWKPPNTTQLCRYYTPIHFPHLFKVFFLSIRTKWKNISHPNPVFVANP